MKIENPLVAASAIDTEVTCQAFGALITSVNDSVIASQPPWLAESVTTMPQCIEFAALLVLAGTGAGRWAGLDYFTYALFHRDDADE